MYRNASLRLACTVCGVEQPIERMTLAPRGGHWCWRCEMRAQIDEHDGRAPAQGRVAPSLRPRRRIDRTVALVVVAVVVVPIGAVALLRLVWAWIAAGWGTC